MKPIKEIITQTLAQGTSMTPTTETKIIPSRSNAMVEVNDEKVDYDFYRCIEFMEQKGIEWFGESFRIEESDHPLIFKLLVYAIGDQENAAEMKINLR